MKTFRITNVSNIATQSRGHFLDMGVENGGQFIPVGASIVLPAAKQELLPACVHAWAKAGLIRISDVENSEAHVGGLSPNLTPSSINPVSEAAASDMLHDDEVDLSVAQEAKMPITESTGPIDQSPSQGAKIQDAMAEERHSTDISPIPGDKPVELGDAKDFTVKAPRSREQGSVIKSK
jgi:hypothetical protein